MNRLFFAIVLTGIAVGASAQTRYILRYTESEPLSTFLARYGLELRASVNGRPIHSVVDPSNRPPSVIVNAVSDDTDDDVSIEIDQVVRLPIFSFARPQTSESLHLRRALSFSAKVPFHGGIVEEGYLNQYSVGLTSTWQSWNAHGLGSGIVAVVDTGVDGTHEAFGGCVLPGLDYLTAGGNGSELTGLSDKIRAMINPTTTPLLGKRLTPVSNGHNVAWEDSKRRATLSGVIPAGLGHGTMVAGAIRLVAPGVQILPVRAFDQSGSGYLFHVIRGIHESSQMGAKIVNLSLNTYTYSRELETTVDEVSDLGVILVASTGNDGALNPYSYPARFRKTTSVASVNSASRRSVFSNAGRDLTWVAAPGEALYLPFPGNRYGGAWGTSFSAPLVSGLAAKLIAENPFSTYSDLQSALSRSNSNMDTNLGLGTLNVFQSVNGL